MNILSKKNMIWKPGNMELVETLAIMNHNEAIIASEIAEGLDILIMSEDGINAYPIPKEQLKKQLAVSVRTENYIRNLNDPTKFNPNTIEFIWLTQAALDLHQN